MTDYVVTTANEIQTIISSDDSQTLNNQILTTNFLVTTANDIQTIISSNESQNITSQIQGPPGPPGPSGNVNFTAAFAWGDAQPATLFTATNGTVITKVEVLILTAFDADAVVTIGDAGDNERLLKPTDIDLTTAGTYQTTPGFIVTESTPIVFYKTLIGNVSAGNGLILIYFED